MRSATVVLSLWDALQCDSQWVQKAMEPPLLPSWQIQRRETEHWIHWSTEPGRGGWEKEAESRDRKYCYRRNKIFFFLMCLNSFVRKDRKVQYCSEKNYFSRKHSSRLNPAILKVIYGMRCRKPLYKLLEMWNLPLDFWKKPSKQQKAVTQTRILMKYVMRESGKFIPH